MTDTQIIARSEPMHALGGHIQGGSPLAGHLGLPSLLVRECVQNSWDARDDERVGPVHFQIDGWDLDTDALDSLRELLPVDDLEGFLRTSQEDDKQGLLHPAAVLNRESVRVLVISDRNTVGLCGPDRSGLEWEPTRDGRPLVRGQQRFANFVRNMGRPTADIGGGDGGAFGVGKSALWMASTCGTVLIHTRTTDEAGEPVERFIGSVHGEHFFAEGREFTGRHFIGVDAGNDLVAPLVGAAADNAARALPLPSYSIDGQATFGTSIVIVEPRLQLPWEIEMERLRDAIRWHVWPKRVPGARDTTDGPDMVMRVGWNNNDVPVPAPLDDPEIRPYAKALLDSVRGRRSDEDHRDHELRCGRPRKLLGTTKFRSGGDPDENAFHITVTESDLEASKSQVADDALVDVEPAIDLHAPWGHIALVRRAPLLLVRYEPINGPEAATAEVGVFLSAEDPEVEAALTAAEPPAHDDWIHKIVPKDHSTDHRRTFAKRTVEEIRRARLEFLKMFRDTSTSTRGGGEQQVSRAISEGLFSGTGGNRRHAATGAPTAGTSRRPSAVLTLINSTQDGDNTVHEIAIELQGLGAVSREVTLTASGKARDNAGSMTAPGHVRYTWSDAAQVLGEERTLQIVAADEQRLSLQINVLGNLRFRPKVTVEVDDAA